jgi:hypothetical protein
MILLSHSGREVPKLRSALHVTISKIRMIQIAPLSVSKSHIRVEANDLVRSHFRLQKSDAIAVRLDVFPLYVFTLGTLAGDIDNHRIS